MATPLPTVGLGRTGLEITRVGFGAWAIGGGGYRFGWGPQEDAESIAAIERALSLGVNWIDTAAVYGLGRSEEVVGRVLAGRSDRVYVFTKVSPFGDDEGNIVHDLSREAIRREAERSLRRLGVDAIDLYQIHNPLPDAGLEEAWSTLVELRDDGVVRHIGVCNVGSDQLIRLEAIAPVETLQIGYSLVARRAPDEVVPPAQREGLGVLVYSPMGSGLLSGAMTAERVAALPRDDWRRRNPNFREPLLSRNLALVERLGSIGARFGASAGAVAVAWALRHPTVTAAIVGFRRPDQVDEVVAAASLELDDETVAEIEELAAVET